MGTLAPIVGQLGTISSVGGVAAYSLAAILRPIGRGLQRKQMREKLGREGDRTQWLDDKEVIRLLKAEVERAGSQSAFAKQTV